MVNPAAPIDRTPYIESQALRKKLQGVTVTAGQYPSGQNVPVGFVGPDFELKSASYPGIYISYGPVTKANDREHRGAINLDYSPPGYDDDIQVPEDFDDKDNTNTVSWRDSADGRTSPYWVQDTPIPYNLEFNVIVLTRNYQQAFEIIAQLDEIERIPARFGGLEVPEDGTVRTLDLVGGPETGLIRDEDGQRLIQTVYSVSVAAELSLYEVQQVQRVASVALDFDHWSPEPTVEAEEPDLYL